MSATMVSTATGRFVWRDLMSTDPEKSEAFFTGLFGWTVNPVDMGSGPYRMLRNGETDFGGIVPLDQPGIPSHWISYISVPNVDETNAKIAALGGQVHVPGTDIPGVGRFSVVVDPTGAVFSPFQDASGSDGSPETSGLPPIGGVFWNELVTSDVAAALAFYKAVFGYGVVEKDMGGGFIYNILTRGDIQEAGVFQMMEGMGLPGSAWFVHFRVADLEASLADVTRLGGQPVGPIVPVPEIGRFSWAIDPTGATFILFEAPK